MSYGTFKKLAAMYHGILGLGGLALSILALALLLTFPVMALAPTEILIGGLVVGLLLLFLTVVSFFALFFSRPIPTLLVHTLLSTTLIAIAAWGLLTTVRSLSPATLDRSLDNLWMTAHNRTIIQIESWGQCCGFHNYTDRLQEPCTLYAQEVGCYGPMRDQVAGKLAAMVVPSTILLIGMLISLGLNLTILLLEWKEGRKEEIVGDRQPFTDWQKTIFQ